MANNLLSVAKFDRLLDKTAGRQVSVTYRTEVQNNITGNVSYTNGTPTNIKAYFLRMNQKWQFDKAARVEGGDAVLLAKYGDNVDKDDLITADGVTYVIKDIIHVPGVFDSSTTPTFVYSYCNLFVWQ